MSFLVSAEPCPPGPPVPADRLSLTRFIPSPVHGHSVASAVSGRHRCVGVRVSSLGADAEAGLLGRLPRSCLAVSPCGTRSSRAREPRLPPQIPSWPALVISQLRHSSRRPGGAPQ